MVRIPVERMTNWELQDHLKKQLKRLDEAGVDEHCSETREALLNLDVQMDETLGLLRGYAEEHDECTGEPCSTLHSDD